MKPNILPPEAYLSTESGLPQILPPGMSGTKSKNCQASHEAPPNPAGAASRPSRLTKPAGTGSEPASSGPSNRNIPPKNCANLQDMMQKPGETVFDYFARNVETFKEFMASKPD
jgi:hypothetical protein